MSERGEGLWGAAGRAAPVLVLRWAVLLAVLLWALPVCAHGAGEPFAAPVPAVSASAVDGDAQVCPDREHGPGGTHCRPVSAAVAGTTGPLAVPFRPVAEETAPDPAPHSPPSRGTPGAPAPTPDIHQLQVQRT
ncbi:hypothetical protein [Streptomyces griseoruber]|uniref:hypothetical protein n=2 Tax=Streptomyces griseoruber TaxID=1943 RepID=UPI000ABDEA37|nr:hypothetical protein [Streptomyces griseoruber]